MSNIRQGARASGYTLLAGAAAIVLALLLASMWVFGYGLFTDATANRQGETSKKQQVEGNGSYRIAAYDHFYDLCAGVRTSEEAIDSFRAELATTTDPSRKTVLNASITAQRANRADAINQYNADARKSYTLGQFKSSDLPYELDTTAKETTCTA